MKSYLDRLDRVAGELNAWLLALAIGLGILDLTVLFAKCMPALPQTPAVTSADGPAPAAAQSPRPEPLMHKAESAVAERRPSCMPLLDLS